MLSAKRATVRAQPVPFQAARLPKRSGHPTGRAPKLRTRAVVDVDADSFESEIVKADVPVVIEFWASWCGPCKLIDPVLKQLDEKHEGNVKFAKIECDSNPDLVEKYEVYGLPSMLMFKDGEALMSSKHEGALGMSGLKSWMESNGAA